MYPTTNPTKTILFAACLGAYSSFVSAGCVSGEDDRINVVKVSTQQELIDFTQDARWLVERRTVGLLEISGDVTDLDVLQGFNATVDIVKIHDTNLAEINWNYNTRTSTFSLTNNAALQHVSISAADTNMRTIDVDGNQGTFTMEVASNPVELQSISIRNNNVTALSMPSIRSSIQFSLTNNPNLCTLDIPVWEGFAKGDGVQNNPCLPSEQVDAINALRTEDAPASEPNGPTPQPETPAPEGE